MEIDQLLHGIGDGAAGYAPHALQHGAAGNAGGGEHDVALGQHFRRQHLIIDGLESFVVHQAAFEIPPQAFHGRRRDHAFSSAADANEQVDAAFRESGSDGSRDIAILNELDTAATRTQTAR